MRNARFILILLLLAGSGILSALVYRGETEKRILKEDLIELSKVKYGIFSVDEWKRILETILNRKIHEFDFNELPKEEIRKKISAMLYEITGNLKDSFKKEKGFIPKAVANITGIFDKMEDDVPRVTETIMQFIEDPENREAVRIFALKKLNDLTDSTFSQIDYVAYDRIIEKYDCKDKEVIIQELNASIVQIDRDYHTFKVLLFLMAGLAALILIFGKRLHSHELFSLILLCLSFLITGLSLPMIEIDARISQMRFALLGETIHFQDQILYYKNKSILEVVQVMISQYRLDIIAVGFMVLLFSVLFPVSKLITSVFYIYWAKVRDNSFVRFMVFRTGKWSMADVMVIAIFMSFIGFSGILREQLQQIEVMSRSLDIFTTNESRLQIGFYAFMTFAILGLLISHRMQYSYTEDKRRELEKQIRHVEKRGARSVRPKAEG